MVLFWAISAAILLHSQRIQGVEVTTPPPIIQNTWSDEPVHTRWGSDVLFLCLCSFHPETSRRTGLWSQSRKTSDKLERVCEWVIQLWNVLKEWFMTRTCSMWELPISTRLSASRARTGAEICLWNEPDVNSNDRIYMQGFTSDWEQLSVQSRCLPAKCWRGSSWRLLLQTRHSPFKKTRYGRRVKLSEQSAVTVIYLSEECYRSCTSACCSLSAPWSFTSGSWCDRLYSRPKTFLR